MMKAETVRRSVVDYTKQEMIRQGVTRLTMDTIAQGLGMSKRTLYQLFPGKVCLVQICLGDISGEKRRLLLQYEDSSRSFIESLLDVAREYVVLIHFLGRTLLTDLTVDIDYQPFVKREEAFWLQQFVDALNRCKACGYLLPGTDPDRFSYDLTTNIYENCLRGVSYTAQRFFCRALLRGIFRADAIPAIDENLEQYIPVSCS